MTTPPASASPMTTPQPAERAPEPALPPGSWDCHAHVFGPFDRFPLLAERRYDPPLATAEDYVRHLDRCGFARGVLVHASASGYDNRCTQDAVRASRGRIVGVAVVPPDIADAELDTLHADGFRAIRVTVTGARVRQFAGSLDFADLRALAPRLRQRGWHAEIWANCAETVAVAQELSGYGLPLVFDHMGYFEPALGVRHEHFQSFLSLLRSTDAWVKLNPLRVSRGDASFASLRPFHESLLAAIPQRLVFGADWPFISLPLSAERTRSLVAWLAAWTPDAAQRRRILVDNPQQLYGRVAYASASSPQSSG